MSLLKTVLFDLDGTLSDPSVGICRSIAYAMTSLGHPEPSAESLLGFIGPPLRSTFQALLGEPDPAVVEEAVRLYRERYGALGLYENRIYDGIPAMLRRVGERAYQMMIATSKPTPYAKRIAQHLGFDTQFRAIHGAEMDGSLDDKSMLLRSIVRQSGIDTDRCVMIGDRSHDVRAAHDNGIRAIGVVWGFGSEEELLESGADSIVNHPDELPAMIDALTTRA